MKIDKGFVWYVIKRVVKKLMSVLWYTPTIIFVLFFVKDIFNDKVSPSEGIFATLFVFGLNSLAVILLLTSYDALRGSIRRMWYDYERQLDKETIE